MNNFTLRREILCFLLIPLLFFLGGLKNILKIDVNRQAFMQEDIELVGFKNDNGVLVSTEENPSIILRNVGSQVKHITVYADGITSTNKNARLYFHDGSKYKEENAFDFRIDDGKNLVNIETMDNVFEITIVFKMQAADHIIINQVDTNDFDFSSVGLAFVICSMLIVSYKSILRNDIYSKVYLFISFVVTYLLYEMVYYHAYLKLYILGTGMLLVLQVFIKHIFKEVRANDEAIENK